MGTVIFMIIFGIILIGGIVSFIYGRKNDFTWTKVTGIAMMAVGGIACFLALLIGTWVSNDVGKAQVFVDSINRRIVGEPLTTPVGGPFMKSLFVDTVEFDLRQQELIYAGAPGQKPEWVGNRNIDGSEVTVQVGGASANLDATINYQLLPSQIIPIVTQYGSQSAFEIQVVKDQALSTVRQVPSGYTTNEFRGAKKGEAEQKMTDSIQTRLKDYISGVAVSIQEIRYPQNIEQQLQEVESAKQEAEKAKAAQEKQRIENATALEKAKTDNDIKIANAKAEADANRELDKSLTPAVLKARQIEALTKANVVYVPYGTSLIAK